LVVRGEAGVGKSALLEYVIAAASGVRVVRAAGVESEMELPYAGLHQLCAQLWAAVPHLPPPQQEALETAFGLRVGTTTERFFVGLAVLGLLSDVAQERPLLCVVDDAHWLDRVSLEALAFVARRLQAESIVLLFATREGGDVGELAGLPELLVGGLPDADARELLMSVIPGPLDERVRDLIVSETRGIPLALLELPRGLTLPELAGGFGVVSNLPLATRIETSFRRRVGRLPAETQRLLTLAAAEPLGDPAPFWRACARLGIARQAAAPADAAGLLTVDLRVRFRHPLVRSAVYRAASTEQRRSAHSALAEATDKEADPDRWAWHLAHAAPGPDERVAAELENSAARAQARGGLAAAAAFLEQAAALTPDLARRGARALAAAQAKHLAGAPDAALRLLESAQAAPLDEFQQAQSDLLRAQVAFAVKRNRDAPPLLLKAAKRLEPLDVKLARETYLEALGAAWFASRLTGETGLLDVAEHACAAPPSPTPRAHDLLLDGLAVRFTEGYAAAASTLKQSLSAFRREDLPSADGLRWLWLACTAAADLWDDEAWEILADRHLRLVRDAGAFSVLPIVLSTRSAVHMYAGEVDAAAALLEEVEAVTEATRIQLAPYAALNLAALRGREVEALKLADAIVGEAEAQEEGISLAVVHYTRSLLYNGLRRYEQALADAQHAIEHGVARGGSMWAAAELVEAAVRTGKANRALFAFEELSEQTRASGTEWALGIEARARALLSSDDAAEQLYMEAIERLGRTRIRVEFARAQLLYGEWLRRKRRRVDARARLRTAHKLFTTMGLEGFADRASRELTASGAHARKRTVETRRQLTPQEIQVARLAREGLSNPEIGARLFISPRTVEYHLHNVFGKLGITSRTELRHVFDNGDAGPRTREQ
jgi:DNA-binding NarL/FixJ family response regulator